VIPGGLGAQAPRYRGTPRREELTRVPRRTAHTAHQLTYGRAAAAAAVAAAVAGAAAAICRY